MMKTSCFVAVILAIASAALAQNGCTGTAQYRLTVANTLTQTRFPNIEENLHFSPLVAFTHVDRFTAFILYGYATKGVQDVAETGNTEQLLAELSAAQDRSQVGDVQTNPELLFSRSNYSVTLTASCDAPFISFITMVAPSPDWFVGTTRLRVVNSEGQFINRAFDRLRVYDAGTDSGETLSAANQVTEPVENIAPLRGEPFMGRVVGRYLLEKVM